MTFSSPFVTVAIIEEKIHLNLANFLENTSNPERLYTLDSHVYNSACSRCSLAQAAAKPYGGKDVCDR